MKKHTLRAAASVLTAALLMTTLTGCAGGGSNNDGGGNNNSNGGNSKNGTLAVSLDHSYASEKIALDGLQYVQGAITFGDKLLVVGADTSYNDLLYLYNPADGSAKNVEFAYPKTLGENAEAYPSSLFMDSDGNLNILFSASSWGVGEDGEDQYEDLGMTIETYDKDFNVLSTTTVDKETLGLDYIDTISADQKGNYYIASWDDASGGQIIGIYDKDFKKTGQISSSIQYVQGMFPSKNGDTYISYYTQDGESKFGKLDPAAGSVTEITVAGMPRWFNEGFASNDENYDFYLYDSNSLYGVNAAKGVCEEVVNWLNSDFLGNQVGEISQMPDGRFVLSSMNYGRSGPGTSEVWVLTPRDPDAFKDTTVISMAGLSLPDELGQAVLNFNRTHDKERIAMVNYEQYNTEEDANAALTKFKNDMTSGIVADIIVTAGLPYESFANKGLFEDLRPYMGNITEQDYFTSFFDSMAYGDKLYNIGFSFDVTTVEGKTSLVGDKQGLTTSEYLDFIKGLPAGMTAFGEQMTKSSALYTLCLNNISAFTDVRNATCNFNTPEFISLLEFCNTFPNDEDDPTSGMSDAEMQEYWEGQETQFLNDKAALNRTYISSLRDSYQERITQFGDVDVTRIGYPVAEGADGNGGCFSAYNTLAMSANSEHKDIVWSFIESMLSDDYQNNLEWSLPVKRSAFKKMAEEAMKPLTYTDENGKEVEQDNVIYRGDEEIKIPNMPQSYADEVEAYIDGIRVRNYYDDQIYNILTEESSMYFSGDQTAEKAAEMIQSRASLYLSEQG